jgi:xanthine/CO dehydrogenase XdhC/CoxF family maturation factor
MADGLAECRAAGTELVLATVVGTQGSTYRKAGARMLLGPEGRWWGLLGGGCFEGDLRERAMAALSGRRARVIEYDMRGDEDLVWGLGAGCEGLTRILLQPLHPQNDYQPLADLVELVGRRQTGVLVTVLEDAGDWLAAGDAALATAENARAYATGRGRAELAALARARLSAGSGRTVELLAAAGGDATVLVEPVRPAPHLLVAGAGPDALPLERMAVELGWDLTVVDRRPAWARAERFPSGTRVAALEPAELSARVPLETVDAALVMTHRLADDALWLDALADAPPRWLGLLGPARRREKVLGELAAGTRARLGELKGPVGLDLGGEGAAAIALSALAEIHATLEGRSGAPLSLA